MNELFMAFSLKYLASTISSMIIGGADEVSVIVVEDDDHSMIFRCLIPSIGGDGFYTTLIPKKKMKLLENKKEKDFWIMRIVVTLCYRYIVFIVNDYIRIQIKSLI